MGPGYDCGLVSVCKAGLGDAWAEKPGAGTALRCFKNHVHLLSLRLSQLRQFYGDGFFLRGHFLVSIYGGLLSSSH